MTIEARMMILLSLEYILSKGLDQVLDSLELTEAEMEQYPHVREVLKQCG